MTEFHHYPLKTKNLHGVGLSSVLDFKSHLKAIFWKANMTFLGKSFMNPMWSDVLNQNLLILNALYSPI